MIEQVKNLLKEKQVSVAVVVDDAYDEHPIADDLSAAPWNSFFDDLSDEQEKKLQEHLGAHYDDSSVEQLMHSDRFVKALWQLQAEIAPAKEIFTLYQETQARKRAVLEPLIALLRDELGMTCHPVGRDAPLEELNGQVIFLDLYMGFVERKEAIQQSAAKVRALIGANPTSPPSVILLSASSEIRELAPGLRDDAEILGCQFRWIPKSLLKDPAAVAENIYDLVTSHADAVTLNGFILSWQKALDLSKTKFMRSIRSLDLADYANVKALILESEGEPLGDYVLDIYDLHLHALLEGDAALAESAKNLTTIDWANKYPPAQFMPSSQLNSIMDGALFHNQVRTDSYFADDSARVPRFGEVILGPKIAFATANAETELLEGAAADKVDEPAPEADSRTVPFTETNLTSQAKETKSTGTEGIDRYAYVVLSQACDLQHCETDRLLLLRGEVRKYSWNQHDRSALMRTPIMRVDENEYCVDWETVTPETWLLSSLEEKLKAGYRRARTFRMPFALQIQQAFIGRLGRVGTLAALPTRFAVGVKIFMKSSGNTAKLLIEAHADAGDAVCLVGRTDKNKTIDWLLLSPEIKEKVRIILRDVEEATFIQETPSLKALRSDPMFLRALSKGLKFNRESKGGSRPFKSTDLDVVEIFTKQKLNEGENIKSLRSLIIEIALESSEETGA